MVINIDITLTPLRIAVFAFVLAILSFGLGIIAILPPFEGSDETAHFARLQSQAFTEHASPASGPGDNARVQNNHITKDVYDYYRQGPMPYMWIDYDLLHKEDPLKGGYITYHDFFYPPETKLDNENPQGGKANAADGTSLRSVDEVAYVERYRQRVLEAGYRPSAESNWQFQHPPLYYLLLAPVVEFFAGSVSLVTLIFVLRLFSYFIGVLGFFIGIRATWDYLAPQHEVKAELITLLSFLYPFLAPEFFWDIARLGNDSLCWLLFGIMWSLLLHHLTRWRSEIPMYLGIVMGLSWLTKAIMIPVSFGVVIFLAIYHFKIIRKKPESAKDWWKGPVTAGGTLLLIGGPVYLLNLVIYKGFGSVEFHHAFAAQQNILTSILNAFSWGVFLGALHVLASTAIWLYGGWSGTLIDDQLLQGFTLIAALVGITYLIQLIWRRDVITWLPIFLGLPLLICLIGHILVMMGVQPGSIFTPGYYLHVLSPALALIYGVGLAAFFKRRWLRFALMPFLYVIILSNFYIVFAYMAMFAGCATPVSTHYPGLILHHLRSEDIDACLPQLPLVIRHLNILAWPHLAMVAMVVTFIALTVGFSLMAYILNRREIYQDHAPY